MARTRRPAPVIPTYTTVYSCGHTSTYGARWPRVGGEREEAAEPCSNCVAAANQAKRAAARDAAAASNGGELPQWYLDGYPSVEVYAAAVQHDEEVRESNARDAAELARILALPEAERPFRTQILQGFGTLESLSEEG